MVFIMANKVLPDSPNGPSSLLILGPPSPPLPLNFTLATLTSLPLFENDKYTSATGPLYWLFPHLEGSLSHLLRLCSNLTIARPLPVFI